MSTYKNLLRVLKVNSASVFILLQLVLREAFLVERHLGVVVLLTHQALEVPVDSFRVFHRLKVKKVTKKNVTQKIKLHYSDTCDIRGGHTTPNALSPKSLSLSLRHTTLGVFLLDSLKTINIGSHYMLACTCMCNVCFPLVHFSVYFDPNSHSHFLLHSVPDQISLLHSSAHDLWILFNETSTSLLHCQTA